MPNERAWIAFRKLYAKKAGAWIEKPMGMAEGSASSGNFGHIGRPGELGGSGEGDGVVNPAEPDFVKIKADYEVEKHAFIQAKRDQRFRDKMAGKKDKFKYAEERDAWKEVYKKEIARGLDKEKAKSYAWDEVYRERDKYEWAEYQHNKFNKHEGMTEGGSGSGNFGHAGRPGELGGSGEGGLDAYHATSETEGALDSILKNGIGGEGGEKSKHFRSPLDGVPNPPAKSTFITTSLLDAYKYADFFRHPDFTGQQGAYVFKVVIPRGTDLRFDKYDKYYLDFKKSYYTSRTIKPEWIKGYWHIKPEEGRREWPRDEDYTKLREARRFQTFYVPFIY